MNVPFHKEQHQTDSFQNNGLLQSTSACKADVELFLELPTFVLCLNSRSRKKKGMKVAFAILNSEIYMELFQQ